ncbi:unnamed protein product [Gadus morhua 'NCC']
MNIINIVVIIVAVVDIVERAESDNHGGFYGTVQTGSNWKGPLQTGADWCVLASPGCRRSLTPLSDRQETGNRKQVLDQTLWSLTHTHTHTHTNRRTHTL